MLVSVRHGNILDFAAEVLITSANPWLSMSGGINGEILSRCGMSIQEELDQYLNDCGLKALPGASVVPTTAPSLPFKHLVHAVAVDAFEDSSEALVHKTLIAAFKMADAVTAESISLPPLATGYGPLSLNTFAKAFAQALDERPYYFERAILVVENQEQVSQIKDFLTEYSFNQQIELF